MTADEALADLQAHAPDLSQESLRRPRIVLLARDFSPIVTASVVWLSEMGLDISLVQITAFRSYVYGQAGSGNVPMISVSQIYPLREVEEFTISPERQLAKQMAESKRRVQDASTVRRLVTAELVADGTIFTLSPAATSTSTCAPSSRSGCTTTPPAAPRTGRTTSPRRRCGTSTRRRTRRPLSVRHIVEQATGVSQDFFGTQWWRDPPGGPWSSWPARSAAARARSTASTGRAGSTESASHTLDPDVDPAGAELHHAALAHPGHALRAQLRGRRPAALGLLHRPRLRRGERGPVRGDPVAAGLRRVDLRRARCRGSASRTVAPTGSPTTARATSPRSRTTPSTSTG